MQAGKKETRYEETRGAEREEEEQGKRTHASRKGSPT